MPKGFDAAISRLGIRYYRLKDYGIDEEIMKILLWPISSVKILYTLRNTSFLTKSVIIEGSRRMLVIKEKNYFK